MNVFEGARRISYVLAFIATIVVLLNAFSNKPYVGVDYVVNTPLANPERMMHGSCPKDGGQFSFSKNDPDGDQYRVSMCLLPMKFGEDGEFLIPYNFDGNSFWGAEKYSQEVSRYKKILEAQFSFSEEDIKYLKAKKSEEYWKSIRESILGLVIGLLVFFGFTWGIGWVMRGFMGIPHGMDKKPK